jgi:hypothetical protein
MNIEILYPSTLIKNPWKGNALPPLSYVIGRIDGAVSLMRAKVGPNRGVW